MRLISTHLALGIIADADQVNVGRAVYLSAAQEERIDATLGGPVEKLKEQDN